MIDDLPPSGMIPPNSKLGLPGGYGIFGHILLPSTQPTVGLMALWIAQTLKFFKRVGVRRFKCYKHPASLRIDSIQACLKQWLPPQFASPSSRARIGENSSLE